MERATKDIMTQDAVNKLIHGDTTLLARVACRLESLPEGRGNKDTIIHRHTDTDLHCPAIA